MLDTTMFARKPSNSEVQEEVERLLARANFLAMLRPVIGRMTYTSRAAQGRADSYIGINAYYGVEIWFYGPEAREMMREVRRYVGHLWKKRVSDYSYTLVYQVPGVGEVTLSTSRQAVCEKVPVLTMTQVEGLDGHPEWVEVPLTEETVVPEERRVKELFEWKCRPVLA